MPGTKRPLIRKVILECGHHLLFDQVYMPAPDDVAWCPRCYDYRKVPMLKEWRVICLSCRFSARYGADIDAALLADARHTKRFPSHQTEVRQSSRIERVA